MVKNYIEPPLLEQELSSWPLHNPVYYVLLANFNHRGALHFLDAC